MRDLPPPIMDIAEVANGIHLCFGEWPGRGPAFVFLHGLTAQHRNIAGVAAALGGRMRVVSVDLRGRGLSSKPPSGSYGIERHARDVIGLLDRLGIERAVVGGHSMGAYVATAIAVRVPERVRGLVLIDGGVYFLPPGIDEASASLLLEAQIRPLLDRLDTTYASPEEYLAFLKGSPYFEGSWGPIAESNYLYELAPTRDGYVPKCERTAADEDWKDVTTNPALRDSLERIRCPVLAIGAEWGLSRGDPSILSEVHLERLREAVGPFEFARVPDTTHHTITLSERGATVCAEAIERFARGLAA